MDNLLSNAAKYGAKNDTIEINLSKANDFARISVTDHGKGIPEDFHKRIFQKFSQASISQFSSGSGLGLSVVKMIAEAHNGSVGFISTKNKGTTFYVDLPIH